MSDGDENRERLSRTERREKAAADALRTLIRDLVTRDLEPHKASDAALPIRIDLEVTPEKNWALSFKPSLGAQVVEQFADHLAERRAYQDGRVFCFRCGYSGCEHGAPPSPTHVFAGFTSTGEPAWHELPQTFIEARDDRVDALYDRRPALLCRVQSGRELKQEQLASFGRASKSYALLGQAVAGYFQDQSRDKFAVSFQWVECRSARGEVQLRVNPVVTMPGQETWEAWLADDDRIWVRRCLRQARMALRETERQINDAGADRHRASRQVLSRVPRWMRELSISVERGHRQTRRRTQHSESRRREQRPVKMAIADARQAADEQWLVDSRTETVVVAGAQHRFHVFNEDGVHVTSFVGDAATIKQRTRRGRWQPLADDRREAVKAVMARTTA